MAHSEYRNPHYFFGPFTENALDGFAPARAAELRMACNDLSEATEYAARRRYLEVDKMHAYNDKLRQRYELLAADTIGMLVSQGLERGGGEGSFSGTTRERVGINKLARPLAAEFARLYPIDDPAITAPIAIGLITVHTAVWSPDYVNAKAAKQIFGKAKALYIKQALKPIAALKP